MITLSGIKLLKTSVCAGLPHQPSLAMPAPVPLLGPVYRQLRRSRAGDPLARLGVTRITGESSTVRPSDSDKERIRLAGLLRSVFFCCIYNAQTHTHTYRHCNTYTDIQTDASLLVSAARERATESEQTKLPFDRYVSRIPLMCSRRDEMAAWN